MCILINYYLHHPSLNKYKTLTTRRLGKIKTFHHIVSSVDLSIKIFSYNKRKSNSWPFEQRSWTSVETLPSRQYIFTKFCDSMEFCNRLLSITVFLGFLQKYSNFMLYSYKILARTGFSFGWSLKFVTTLWMIYYWID